MKSNCILALLVALTNSEKTSVSIASEGGYSMDLVYWVDKLPEDEFSPLYLFFETKLSSFTPFTEDLLVSQWYKFYQIDEEKSEQKR